MRALLLTVCVAALAPFTLAADESHNIKIKRHPAPGKSFTIRDTTRSVDRTRLTDAAGKVILDGKVRKEVREEEYTETTVEGGEPAPKKFKRFYRKARVDRGKGLVAEAREGKVVVFELKDGKYHVSVEDKGELPKRELANLAKEAEGHLKDDLNTAILPGRAVKVGETWVIPAKKLMPPTELVIDPARSKAEGRLVKVYKKGGHPWGRLQLKASLVLNKLDNLQFDPPGAMEIEVTFDAPIDGTGPRGQAQSKFTIAGKGTAEQGGMRFTFQTSTQVETIREAGD
jgi:hypothetical protein